MPVLNNRLYDALKWVALVALPASGALYKGLSLVWGFQNADKVVATTVTIDAFLGALLNLASKAYNASDARFAGKINVVDTDSKTIYDMEVHGDPADIADKDEVTFKVNHKKHPVAAKKATKRTPRKKVVDDEPN